MARIAGVELAKEKRVKRFYFKLTRFYNRVILKNGKRKRIGSAFINHIMKICRLINVIFVEKRLNIINL